jgi:PAS domain S-box-containing protein
LTLFSIAHSFPSGVPSGLLNRNVPVAAPVVHELRDERGSRFFDVALHLAADNTILHLGLDRDRIDRASLPSLMGIATICGMFFVLLLYPASRVASNITREITAITEQLRKANERLETRVAERTAELQEANARIEAGREYLAVTLRSIGDGVITTDVDGRITLLNREAEGLTGWQQEEALGRALPEVFRIINQNTRENAENPVEKVLRTGGIVGLANHTVLIAKNGCERVIADSGAPIRDSAHRLFGVVLVFRDVTDRERMELDLQRSAKLDSIAVLAGGIAHDFNNLLTAILGNINLAQLELHPTSPSSPLLERATEAALRARNLALRLLTFAKGNAPIRKPHSIEALVREAAELALSGSKTRCRFDIQPGLPAVDVDAGQIGQVIHNLLLNADQAMPDGGIIFIRGQAVLAESQEGIPLTPGLYVRLLVEDKGSGISE